MGPPTPESIFKHYQKKHNAVLSTWTDVPLIADAPSMFIPLKTESTRLWDEASNGSFRVRKHCGPVSVTISLRPYWKYESVAANLTVEWNIRTNQTTVRPVLGKEAVDVVDLYRSAEEVDSGYSERSFHVRRQAETIIGVRQLTRQWKAMIEDPSFLYILDANASLKTLGVRLEEEPISIPFEEERMEMNFDPKRLDGMDEEELTRNTLAAQEVERAWASYCTALENLYGIVISPARIHALQQAYADGICAPPEIRKPGPAYGATITHIRSHTLTVDPSTGQMAVKCRHEIPRDVLHEYQLEKFKEELTGKSRLDRFLEHEGQRRCEEDGDRE